MPGGRPQTLSFGTTFHSNSEGSWNGRLRPRFSGPGKENVIVRIEIRSPSLSAGLDNGRRWATPDWRVPRRVACVYLRLRLLRHVAMGLSIGCHAGPSLVEGKRIRERIGGVSTARRSGRKISSGIPRFIIAGRPSAFGATGTSASASASGPRVCFRRRTVAGVLLASVTRVADPGSTNAERHIRQILHLGSIDGNPVKEMAYSGQLFFPIFVVERSLRNINSIYQYLKVCSTFARNN